MFYRRSPIRLLLLIGAGVFIGMILTGGFEAVTTLAMIPFLILAFAFKMLLFVMLFGFIFGAVKRHGYEGGYRSRRRPRQSDDWMDEARTWWNRHEGRRRTESKPDKSDADRFADWHRMAHARREVDEHAPPIDDLNDQY